MNLADIVNFFSNWEGIVAVVAFVLALFDLFLHWKEHFNERAKLVVRRDFEESFSLSFHYFHTYHCAIVKLSIDNKSKSEITMSSFSLVRKSKESYTASEYNGTDLHNKEGISLYTDEHLSEGYTYNIKSENLLHNKRIEGYGNVEGFLYFQFPDQIFSDAEDVDLVIHTPRKKFKQKISIPKLPESLRPYHPAKVEQ